MRQETITREYRTFEELNESEKQAALDEYRDFNVSDSFWHECAYEDAKTIGALIGFNIDRIYFSGFWSQGDGACFEGDLTYAKNCVKSVKEYAPKDTELHGIAQAWADLQKRYFYRITATVKHSGHYQHEYCTAFDVWHGDEYASADVEESVQEIARDFMRWIYGRLESDYEYYTSDECVAESLIANEVEFESEREAA